MYRSRTILTAALVALAAAALYLPDLAGSPFYVNRDEMFFGLTAHSLATTGYDTAGHYLPFYTQSPMRYGSEMWFQPALMYTAALSVKLFGLSEGTVRLPMALFGIADIVLMYLIGRRLFSRELPALGAAALLAATPAHYIHSRVAMDFQAPLPFLLLWLLCALTYFETGKSRYLVGAGVALGVGLFTYIAAYMWMPVYGVLTVVAMLMRREPARRYALFLAACVVPALSCVPFLVTHPTVIRDVMWHYDRQQPQSAAGGELMVRYFDLQRFARAAFVYRQFWTPRFLFIDGPGGLWAAGAFLFPTAGALVIGLVALLRRLNVETILLVGGLVTAMIPASLVGDVDAIHRASAVLPFGTLIAIMGLDRLRLLGPSAAVVAFGALWVMLIALATMYHDDMVLAQAAVRASTVPLVIAALAMLLQSPREGRLSNTFWLSAVAAAVLIQFAFLAAGVFVAIAIAIVAVIALWIRDGREVTNRLQGTALGFAAACFIFAHADYAIFTRIGPVPATLVIIAARIVFAVVAVAGFAAILRLTSRLLPASEALTMTVFALLMAVVQFAYFRADLFTAYLARSGQAIAVFAAFAAVSVLAGRAGSTSKLLAWTCAAAFAGLVTIQFGYFYGDYFTQYRAHAGHFDTEGNQRTVWEAVVKEADAGDVPAIYFGSVGPYGFADLYWQFYAIKHGRPDLLTRSAGDLDLRIDRIEGLPAGSLVVTSPAPAIDAAITRLQASGVLAQANRLTAPDGRSTFWLLRTRAPG